MSFLQTLTPLLLADLAQLLGLPHDSVYLGREPQKVARAGLEVWVRPQEGESLARGGGHQLRAHALEVHVRLKTLREADQTGADQLGQVQATLEQVRARYDGARPFVQDLPDLIAVHVEELSTDEDPSVSGTLAGSLLLRVLER